MKKNKISFHSTYSYPLFNTESKVKHGGAEIQVSFIAKELAKDKKNEVLCLVGDFGQEKTEIFDEIKVIKTFNPGTKSIFIELISSFFYFLKLIKHNPSVLISSGAGSLVGVIALYKVLFRKKLIYRVSHKMDTDKTWVKKNKLGFLFEFALKNADKIVCQAKYQTTLLKENYGLSSDIIPNFYQISENKKNKKNTVLFVARCEEWKNPNLFIQLAKQNKKVNFVMICPPSKDLAFFEEINTKASVINNLQFIKKVPFNQIQKYFDEASIFVNLSDFEGFPNTFIQAGIAKTPILSLSVNPDDFINTYDCGFVCDNNFEILNKNLNILLENNAVWKQKSENSFSYVNENHNIKLNFEKYKQIIEC